MGKPGVKRNIFQRLLGICATQPPSDTECWSFADGKITVDLAKAPELAVENGAIRLEGKGIPDRALVFKGVDGQYHAFRNMCAHAKRRLDPVPGDQTVQCCSIGKSIYDYQGKIVSGMAGGDIRTYPVTEEAGKLVITLQ